MTMMMILKRNDDYDDDEEEEEEEKDEENKFKEEEEDNEEEEDDNIQFIKCLWEVFTKNGKLGEKSKQGWMEVNSTQIPRNTLN